MLIRHQKVISLLLFLSFCLPLRAADTIRVGLLSLNRAQTLTVNICGGEYRMLAAGQQRDLKLNDNVLISRAGDRILVSTRLGKSIMADSLIIQAADTTGCFSLRNNMETGEARQYNGGLIILPDIQSLLAINIIDADRYLAGVVQTEAGFRGNIEYFKVQSLLARTYLHMYINRHLQDAYNVCDKIHCQAYHGRSVVNLIHAAVRATRDRVLADADSLIVFAPFHSNCGGQTESSGNVWLSGMPHLVSVTDPYCRYSRNAVWKKEISIEEWVSYLTKHAYRDSAKGDLAFEQLSRKKDYSAGSFSYPLTMIREDWKLKSTFFSVRLSGSKLVLDGRGYGHGVGLCQEGALVMAERGFTMEEIAGFYFRDLLILDINDVKPPPVINTAF